MTFLALAVAHADTVYKMMPVPAAAPTIADALNGQTVAMLAGMVTVLGVLVRLLDRVISQRLSLGQGASSAGGVPSCNFTPEAKAGLEKVAQMAAAVDGEQRPVWVFPQARFDAHHAQTMEILQEMAAQGAGQTRAMEKLVEINERLERRPCPIGNNPPQHGGYA